MREVEQTRERGVERKKEKEEGAAMWGGSGVKKKMRKQLWATRKMWTNDVNWCNKWRRDKLVFVQWVDGGLQEAQEGEMSWGPKKC